MVAETAMKLETSNEPYAKELPIFETLVGYLSSTRIFEFLQSYYSPPCATSPGEVVTNGGRRSKRDRKTAIQELLVRTKTGKFYNVCQFVLWAGMEFQKNIDRCLAFGGENQRVPATAYGLILRKVKVSADIPKTSMFPGNPVELDKVFPGFLTQIMREGFVQFANPCEVI
ncbi:hypothetical protein FQR65_LT19535 [Abscondita terminalis]|nr:hypothetical protein FQR65_LT19535 [Abscondita terminalis]